MHLYRAGMPLVLLAEFLGHADVNTTRIYAWADTEMKRQAIQKVSKVTDGDTIEPIWANDEELIKAPLWFGLILPHFNRVHNAATRS